MKIYVASSWKNEIYSNIILELRKVFDVYDFRRPISAFCWSEIDENWIYWSVDQYIENLNHPLAIKGYNSDFLAMQQSECCVLVLPCGKSAHLEAGWFVGKELPLLIFGSKIEPELMYKMADSIHKDLKSLIIRLKEIEIHYKKH